MKRVKGFNFDTVEDREIIEHIENQPNQSSYIKELVRKDMNKESIEEIIKKQIEKYLEGFEMKSTEKSTQIDVSEIQNILQI